MFPSHFTYMSIYVCVCLYICKQIIFWKKYCKAKLLIFITFLPSWESLALAFTLKIDFLHLESGSHQLSASEANILTILHNLVINYMTKIVFYLKIQVFLQVLQYTDATLTYNILIGDKKKSFFGFLILLTSI